MLPLLLRSPDAFGLAWLSWLTTVGEPGGLERVELDSACLPRLIELMAVATGPQPSSVLPLPPKDPLNGATYGLAREGAAALLRGMLLSDEESRRGRAIDRLRTWVREDPVEHAPRAATAVHELMTAEEQPWPLQLALVDLGLLQHGLWLPPVVKNWRRAPLPTDRESWAFVTAALEGPVPDLDPGLTRMIDACLVSLVAAWLNGVLQGRAIEPTPFATVCRLVRQRPVVRGQAGAAVRSALQHRQKVPGEAAAELVLAFTDARDVRNAMPLLGSVVFGRPKRLVEVAEALLALVRARPDQGTRVSQPVAELLHRLSDSERVRADRLPGTALLAAVVLWVEVQAPDDPIARENARAVSDLVTSEPRSRWALEVGRRLTAMTRPVSSEPPAQGIGQDRDAAARATALLAGVRQRTPPAHSWP